MKPTIYLTKKAQEYKLKGGSAPDPLASGIITFNTKCGRCWVTCAFSEFASSSLIADGGGSVISDEQMKSFLKHLLDMGALSLYQTEFTGITPAKEILDAVASGALVDTSWHNDICASFRRKADENLTADEAPTLWVNFDNPDLREEPFGAKYHVYLSEVKDGYCGDDAAQALAQILAPAEEKYQRFALTVGHYVSAFTDMPEGLPLGIYDRQEKKMVTTIAPEYGNLICLETTEGGMENAPITNLENWLNNTDNEAFESEGIPATLSSNGAKLQQVASILVKHGHKASYEYPGYIHLSCSNGSTFYFGEVNGPFGYDLTDARDCPLPSSGKEIPAESSVQEMVAFVISILDLKEWGAINP